MTVRIGVDPTQPGRFALIGDEADVDDWVRRLTTASTHADVARLLTDIDPRGDHAKAEVDARKELDSYKEQFGYNEAQAIEHWKQWLLVAFGMAAWDAQHKFGAN